MTTRYVTFSRGAGIKIELEGNLFSLIPEELTFLFDLAELIQRFESARIREARLTGTDSNPSPDSEKAGKD